MQIYANFIAGAGYETTLKFSVDFEWFSATISITVRSQYVGLIVYKKLRNSGPTRK